LAPVRIAILGDTHMPKGQRRLPADCLEAIEASDLVVHTGDFTGPEALELVAAIGPPLVAVHGNVDAPAVTAQLPERTSFDAGGSTIALIHDAGARKGRLGRMRRAFPEADAVLFGHSHLPLHEQDDDGFQIFNPGSPTERRRAPRRSMGIGWADEDGLRFEHLWF
jgi:putative phosphoesterase